MLELERDDVGEDKEESVGDEGEDDEGDDKEAWFSSLELEWDLLLLDLLERWRLDDDDDDDDNDEEKEDDEADDNKDEEEPLLETSEPFGR